MANRGLSKTYALSVGVCATFSVVHSARARVAPRVLVALALAEKEERNRLKTMKKRKTKFVRKNKETERTKIAN